jgi:hypothetical protein
LWLSEAFSRGHVPDVGAAAVGATALQINVKETLQKNKANSPPE